MIITWEQVFRWVLQGIATTIIGSIIYQAYRNGFYVNNESKTKNKAQLIVIGLFIFIGLANSQIILYLNELIHITDKIQQFFILIISSRIVVNILVDNWTFNDDTSLFIYVFSGLIIILRL